MKRSGQNGDARSMLDQNSEAEKAVAKSLIVERVKMRRRRGAVVGGAGGTAHMSKSLREWSEMGKPTTSQIDTVTPPRHD